MESTLYTIGHGTLRFDEFLHLLYSHGIRMVLDVRSQPYSRNAPQYSSSALQEELAAAGLAYRWLGDRLGGRPLDESKLAPIDIPEKLDAGITEAGALATGAVSVLLCAERDPDHCHRSLTLADRFEEAGFTVRHVLSDGSTKLHQPQLGLD